MSFRQTIEPYLRKPWVRTALEVAAALVVMRFGVRLIGLLIWATPLGPWSEGRPEREAPLTIVAIVPLILLCLSILSGWWGLSLRYKTSKPKPANRRTGSATFRYVIGYNNVVRLGSDHEGLFISSWMRLFHPPLFIPWQDIEVVEPKVRRFFRSQMFKLGPANRVPFTVAGKTGDWLLAARNPPPDTILRIS